MGFQHYIGYRKDLFSFVKTSLLLILFIFVSYFIYVKFIPYAKVPISQQTFIWQSTNITLQNFSSIVNLARCIVVVTEVSGRLGNRMFIVASAYGLARLHSCHLYLSPKVLEDILLTFNPNFSSILISTDTFNQLNDKKTGSVTVEKDITCQYVHELSRPNAISNGQVFHVVGYWQSYLYFIKYIDELRNHIFLGRNEILRKSAQLFLGIYEKKFSIKPQLVSNNHMVLKQQLTDLDRIVWIGIHIRRTDFVDLKFSSSDSYILNSIQYFTQRYTAAHFLIASDDKSYCQNLLRDHANVTIIPGSFSLGEDLVTLSLCEHTIITGGTFGWWAGFLAGGNVLHDVVYPSGCEKREHYYPPWFLIDGHVRAHRDSNYTL